MNGATTTASSTETSNEIIEIVPGTRASPSQLQQPNGFCHSCNKNVYVQTQNYVCSECNGGFIELLENMEGETNGNGTGGSADTEATHARPIDRLINPIIQLRDAVGRPELSRSRSRIDTGLINQTETGGFNERPPPAFIYVGSGDSANTTPERSEDFSPLTTPIFQLIRRLNNRHMRASNVSSELTSTNNRETIETDLTETSPVQTTNTPGSGVNTSSHDEVLIDTDSDSNNEWPGPLLDPRISSSATFGSDQPITGSLHHTWNSGSRPRTSSFHYRLRRHVHTPSSDQTGQRRIPIHRHRFHRSPSAPRFQFNFNDNDDDFLNDHGAIIITTLINQLRNTNRGAAPASDTDIQSLPKVDIDQELVEQISQCAICMEVFTLNDSAKKLPCNHLYHLPCIDQWLKLHATCPICRKNISSETNNNPDNLPDSIINPRSTLLNIFPLSSSANSTSGIPIAQLINRNHNSSDSTNTNNSQQSQTHSRARSQPIRNRQLYRIQIRQALDNNGSSGMTNSGSNTSDLEHLENHRQFMGDTLAQSLAFEEQRNGVRATAVLINPQWATNNNTNSNSGGGHAESEERNDINQSAFSIMNEYRNRRLLERPAEQDRWRSSSESVSSTEPTSGSRISSMMDRLLRRYRNNRLVRNYFNSTGQNLSTISSNPNRRDHAHIRTSITINNQPIQGSQSQDTSAGSVQQPSISVRLGQLFRTSMQQTTSPESDINHISPSTNQESNTTTIVEQPGLDTENPNNYFDFSIFNRSQIHENRLLLDRLFDIPEDVQQLNSDDNEEMLGADSEASSDERDLEDDETEHVPELMTIRDDEDEDDDDIRTEYGTTSSGINRLESNNELTSDMPQAKKQKTGST